MRPYTFVFSALSAVALAAGLALTSTTALAQHGDSAQQSNGGDQEQVTVVGPRIMRTKVHGTADAGFGIGYYDMLTLSHRVSYSDLDLTQPEDAKTLKNRIDETANQICQQLAEASPPRPTSRDCVYNAVQSAMEQAHVAIAAAKR